MRWTGAAGSIRCWQAEAMRAGLLQLSVGDLPLENVPLVRDAVRQAVSGGAGFVLTPECTNCISADRKHQQGVLTIEGEDPVLAMLRDEAARAGIWLLAGSLIVKTGDPEDPRFANRSILIGPDGAVTARYDKIHLFDVQVSETETYRESAGIRPGDKALVAKTDFATLGMTVCYDVRFAHLYRALAKAGAQVLTVPAAFSPVTGAAHWHTLLRARVIETGCYVAAAAQTGQHDDGRETYGHSLVVAPWGELIADGGEEPGVTFANLDLKKVAEARSMVPALGNDRDFTLTRS